MKSRLKQIGSFEAKTHLSRIIEDVQKGMEFTITKRGKPVARLVPCDRYDDSTKINDVMLEFDSVRNSVKGKVNIKEYINEGRKY